MDGQGVFNVEYNINNQPYFLDVDLNQTLGSDLSKLDYTLSGVQETNAGDYTATFTISVKANVSGVVIPQGKDTFTLKWRINKAKLDLSSVAWDYTTPLPFNNKTQTVSLQLPAGLSPTYLSSSNQGKSVSNAYSAVVTAITITDPDMNKNYHTPTVGGKGTTYIYNGSGRDLPWTLSWEICVGPLDLEWEAVDIYTDVNGRKFKYAQVKNDYKIFISGYEYYTLAEYNNGNPTVQPRTLNDIEVVAGQADTYYAVAILDSATWGNSYYITPTSQAKDFTVGSTKTEIFIEMTQRNHTYDGQKFGDGWQIKQGSSPIGSNVVIGEYYSIASDGTRTLLTDGVPKNVGKYVVVFKFRDPDDANEYEIII
ncbi:MAG: hypothetical protein K2K24_03705, partial [Clostridia bacterium]|nr:hypothetical protein [Clostridia bacterium]